MFLFCVNNVYTTARFLVNLKTMPLLSYWILPQTQMELLEDFNNVNKVKNKLKIKLKKRNEASINLEGSK